MAKLYYGNGDCEISGSGIRGVQIKYRGNIKIEKTAGDNFVMAHANNGIMFFPVGEGYLNELFKYRGTLKIISVIAAGSNGERVLCYIKRVMDYSELLESTAETMTINVEDMDVGHNSLREINETPQILENQHTENKDTPFYLQDGSIYKGYYHIYLEDSSCITGEVNDENSQDLYFKQVENGEVIDKLIPTKNPSHIPPIRILRKGRSKIDKARRRK
tara:strand:+ start:4622 stop:5275 length:654 start_codon:yes stop_codon:yes gene_type:complete